jgi:hypothetical protein
MILIFYSIYSVVKFDNTIRQKEVNIMRHNKWYIMISLLFIFISAVPAWAWHGSKFSTYDPHIMLLCEIVQLKSASGRPSSGEKFKIEATGSCSYYHWREESEDFGRIDTWLVLYQGSYDYTTKKASEVVKYKGNTILKHNIICSHNPWAHAVCDKATRKKQVQKYSFHPLLNPTNIPEDVGPWNMPKLEHVTPLSAYLLPIDLKNALVEWERTQSNEEMLADWVPMSDLGGPPALTIKKPFESQPINVNDDWLNFRMEINPGFEGTLDYLLEVERLEEVSGEIVDSTGKTHMWQPTGAIPNPTPSTRWLSEVKRLQKE